MCTLPTQHGEVSNNHLLNNNNLNNQLTQLCQINHSLNRLTLGLELSSRETIKLHMPNNKCPTHLRTHGQAGNPLNSQPKFQHSQPTMTTLPLTLTLQTTAGWSRLT